MDYNITNGVRNRCDINERKTRAFYQGGFTTVFVH